MDPREPILNQTDFFLSLAKKVISVEAKDSNFVFSPLSIHIVLGLIGVGSDCTTRDQLLSVLKCKSIEELNSVSSQVVTLMLADGRALGGPRLSFANGIWVDQSLSFKPTFKEITENIYKTVLKHVDFQNKAEEVRQEVNSWIEKVTNGLLKDTIPFGIVNAMTRSIFANAMYFKGAWEKTFDQSETEDYDFFLLDGTSVQVPFMTNNSMQYICTFEDFKVLGLPYEQDQDKHKFSMYIFLPNAKDGLTALFDKMSSVPGFIDHHLPTGEVEVSRFRIPRYKTSFSFEATEVLKDMGLVHPFSGGGLTEMVDSTNGQDLHVSNIFHKAFIEVNEEGTEAAAETDAECMGFSLEDLVPEVREEFVADHPFLFVLREDMSGVVLFMGQVLNPLAE